MLYWTFTFLITKEQNQGDWSVFVDLTLRKFEQLHSFVHIAEVLKNHVPLIRDSLLDLTTQQKWLRTALLKGKYKVGSTINDFL